MFRDDSVDPCVDDGFVSNIANDQIAPATCACDRSSRSLTLVLLDI